MAAMGQGKIAQGIEPNQDTIISGYSWRGEKAIADRIQISCSN